MARDKRYISRRTIKGHAYYVVRVANATKYFSVEKHGDALALKMAEKYRDSLVSSDRRRQRAKTVIAVKYTVQHAFERSLALYCRAQATKRQHAVLFNAHFEKFKGMPLADVRARDIVEHLNDHVTDSQNTLSRIRMIWIQIFNAGILDEAITSNIAQAIPVPQSEKIVTVRPKFTERDTIKRVISELTRTGSGISAHSHRLGTLIAYAIMVISETGMRPAECYALARSDIDLTANTIKYGNRVGLSANGYSINRPKTATSYRVNPITERLRAVLESLIAYNPREYLFEYADGRLLNSDLVSTRIRSINKAIGTDFRMYQLRHNFVRDIINAEIGNDRTVMDILGHARYSQTLDYTKSTLEQRREALEKAGH